MHDALQDAISVRNKTNQITATCQSHTNKTILDKLALLENKLTTTDNTITEGKITHAMTDSNLSLITMKVNTFFIPIKDSFEYNHLVQKHVSQNDALEVAAKHSSNRRNQMIDEQEEAYTRLSNHTTEAYILVQDATETLGGIKETIDRFHKTLTELRQQMRQTTDTPYHTTNTTSHSTAITETDSSRTSTHGGTSSCSALTELSDHSHRHTKRYKRGKHDAPNRIRNSRRRPPSPTSRPHSPPPWNTPPPSSLTDYSATRVNPN